MAEFLNPVPYLEDLAHVFRDGAANPDGLTIDPVLCMAFADGLADVAEKVDRLVAFVAVESPVADAEPAFAPPRTPVERRRIARMSVPLDPAGRVLSFPSAPTAWITCDQGGSAA